MLPSPLRKLLAGLASRLASRDTLRLVARLEYLELRALVPAELIALD